MYTVETNGKTENLSKETGDIKSQMETLELKNTITKIKISVDGLNRRMDMTQERVSELEDRSIESIQSEQQRERMIWNKKKKRASGTCGTILRGLTLSHWNPRGGRERIQCIKKYI